MDIALYGFALFGLVGIVAVISAIIYFFTAIGKNVRQLKLSAPVPKVSDPQFLNTLASVSGGTLGSLKTDDVDTIIDGNDFFKTLRADIVAAQSSINIAAYVWKDHPLTKVLISELKQKVTDGITVRVLIDHVGSTLSQSTLEKLRESGIEVGIFRAFTPGKLSRYHQRTHRRSIIIDDAIAYAGGMAMSDEWFGTFESEERMYTDVMYRFSGEVVHHIRSAFDTLWTSVTGEIIVSGGSHVHTPAAAINFLHLNHRPQVDIHPLTYLLWTAITAAEDEIVLCSPYFVPGSTLADALMERARAGVKVTLILQGVSELQVVKNASRSYYENFFAAGVEIFEYDEHYLHTKLMVVDNLCTVLGSANYDIRSQRLNMENVICYIDQSFAQEQRSLLTSYLKGSRKIHESEFEGISRFKLLKYNFLHLFSEQF